jgi:hypothetical protein
MQDIVTLKTEKLDYRGSPELVQQLLDYCQLKERELTRRTAIIERYQLITLVTMFALFFLFTTTTVVFTPYIIASIGNAKHVR